MSEFPLGVAHVLRMWWPCHGRSFDFGSALHRVPLSVTTGLNVVRKTCR